MKSAKQYTVTEFYRPIYEGAQGVNAVSNYVIAANEAEMTMMKSMLPADRRTAFTMLIADELPLYVSLGMLLNPFIISKNGAEIGSVTVNVIYPFKMYSKNGNVVDAHVYKETVNGNNKGQHLELFFHLSPIMAAFYNELVDENGAEAEPFTLFLGDFKDQLIFGFEQFTDTDKIKIIC